MQGIFSFLDQSGYKATFGAASSTGSDCHSAGDERLDLNYGGKRSVDSSSQYRLGLIKSRSNVVPSGCGIASHLTIHIAGSVQSHGFTLSPSE
ncbi:hypothetical protein RRG08_063497 [Elysia crispata]|uniref:Uncharacterized protein n=1 Tax=Elysia crispata TaxID=231223 RepID=A0AAE1B487_9GAST|nr:hypothetical protein RRG08_063497 [Elysia crispata]